jgi:hypothetical protein
VRKGQDEAIGRINLKGERVVEAMEHEEEPMKMQIIRSKRREVDSGVEQLHPKRMNSHVRRPSVLFNCYEAWREIPPPGGSFTHARAVVFIKRAATINLTRQGS